MIRKIHHHEFEKITSLIKTNFNYNIAYHPFLNILIWDDNNILGFLAYDLIYDRIEIEYIGVIPDYQNNHIASQLLTYLFDHENNIKNTTLEVAVTNQKAIHLYKKFGFIVVTTKKNYYQNVDACYMIRK